MAKKEKEKPAVLTLDEKEYVILISLCVTS